MFWEFVLSFGSLRSDSGVCIVVLEFVKCLGSLRCDSGSLRSSSGVCVVVLEFVK